MYKYNILIFFVIFGLLFQGCSQVLEPVLFEAKSEKDSAVKQQEVFSFQTETLTFDVAKKANKDKYLRKLMLTGSGTKSNVFNEDDFLDAKIPISLNEVEHRLGYGDELSFVLYYEYANNDITWPVSSGPREYLLGIGDELTFIQNNNENVTNNIDLLVNKNAQNNLGNNENIVSTNGIVGSGGNILLLGLGNIKALGRSLNDIRAETRNILIRKGYAPNFQLEITQFNSKKAFIVSNEISESEKNSNQSTSIPITFIPITLKELCMSLGLTNSSKKKSLITLLRDKQTFRITAEQLFGNEAPKVFIEDKDQIEITNAAVENIKSEVFVGTDGNIILPKVGTIQASNRTLIEVQSDIREKLIEVGLMPEFQFELKKSRSRKAYLIGKNINKVIPLTNLKVTLKELILANSTLGSIETDPGLRVVTLTRNKKSYRMALDTILDKNAVAVWIHDKDQIEINNFSYKPGQVYALSGGNSATIVPISPSKRETLADVLFVSGGVLKNINSKRSEVYLLRGRNPSKAYHLDTRSVSRIMVAAATELRPNDIVYVAERPVISFARTLNELLPIRILMRDIQEGNIP